jgi:dsRNA-specific ribonuclease
MDIAAKEMKKVKTFAEFFELELPSLKQPADVWEALAAGLLLDGGLTAAREVFLRLLAPFIMFFVFQLSPVLNFFE